MLKSDEIIKCEKYLSLHLYWGFLWLFAVVVIVVVVFNKLEYSNNINESWKKEGLKRVCICPYRKIRKSMSKINASFIQESFAVIGYYAGS